MRGTKKSRRRRKESLNPQPSKIVRECGQVQANPKHVGSLRKTSNYYVKKIKKRLTMGPLIYVVLHFYQLRNN